MATCVWVLENSVWDRVFSDFYLNFSFDKGGDVILVLEDGEGLQQVVLQPLPVLRDLLARASCGRGGEESQSIEKGDIFPTVSMATNIRYQSCQSWFPEDKQTVVMSVLYAITP